MNALWLDALKKMTSKSVQRAFAFDPIPSVLIVEYHGLLAWIKATVLNVAQEGNDMTVPFWCVFVACILPFVWVTFAAIWRKQQFGTSDNKLPRVQQAQLEGKAARAHGAHLNAFEALALFAPAVIINHLAKADPTWSMYLAIGWVVFRLLHGIFYLTDIDKARSAIFGLANLCVVGLFVLGAMAPSN